MEITIINNGKAFSASASPDETILEVLQRNEIQSVHAPCGGKGTCKKCLVNVSSSSGSGACLSCLTKVEEGMIVEVSSATRYEFAGGENARSFIPDPGLTGYAAIVDFGTTTIACSLYDRSTGIQLATASDSNRQSAYGDNVLARLQAVADGYFPHLRKIAIRQLNMLLKSLCRDVGIQEREIAQLVITGNTLMEHILAGLNPTENGKAVMTTCSHFGESIPSADLGIEIGGDVYFLPVVSPLLGGDITAGLYAADADRSDTPVLFCDMGTNIEILLGCGDHFVACTADAGSVFKASLMEKGMISAAGAIASVEYRDGEFIPDVLGGGKPLGICGSGMISILGVLCSLEILDEQGHIPEEDEVSAEFLPFIGREHGERVFYLTKDHAIYITQGDISRFQLAKAAVYAGIQVLLYEYGIHERDIAKVFLAGGFGAFVNVDAASSVGLIPATLLKRSNCLGNSSLAGAAAAALQAEARTRMEAISRSIRVIELPTHKMFDDAYVEGMFFM